MNQIYNEYRTMVEDYLDGCFLPDGISHGRLLEAMRYSLLAGGKRLRPILTLEFCRACGGDPKAALPIACAVEMLHTYSLIHDDLPCMDNDDMRRGKPTNHKVFGECTATLAGDALQAAAFGTIMSAPLSSEIRAECGKILADTAGTDGICGGQYLDMSGEGRVLNLDELSDIHNKKTASMIIAACRMGVTAAGGDEARLKAASMYGASLGIAFQIRDDMLDEISTEVELGKPIGSDKAEEKTTFMSIYGINKCQDMISEFTENAKAAISGKFFNTDFLSELADELSSRKK